MHSLAAQIVSAAENHNYDGEVEGWSKDWFFPNALHTVQESDKTV